MCRHTHHIPLTHSHIHITHIHISISIYIHTWIHPSTDCIHRCVHIVSHSCTPPVNPSINPSLWQHSLSRDISHGLGNLSLFSFLRACWLSSSLTLAMPTIPTVPIPTYAPLSILPSLSLALFSPGIFPMTCLFLCQFYSCSSSIQRTGFLVPCNVLAHAGSGRWGAMWGGEVR